MKDALSVWVRALLEAVFPFTCQVCGAAAPWRAPLCATCDATLQRCLLPPFRVTDLAFGGEALSLGSYEGLLAEAVKAAKYRPSRRMAQRLAEALAQPCRPPWPVEMPDVIVPVPLHPTREAERGFNQAAVLGRALAAAVGKPFSPALVRVRATRPQADCTEEERVANLAGAFAPATGLRESAFAGRRLCLVDDVATTGATLDRCRQALLPLRPRSVMALTLAHPPRRLPRL